MYMSFWSGCRKVKPTHCRFMCTLALFDSMLHVTPSLIWTCSSNFQWTCSISIISSNLDTDSYNNIKQVDQSTLLQPTQLGELFRGHRQRWYSCTCSVAECISEAETMFDWKVSEEVHFREGRAILRILFCAIAFFFYFSIILNTGTIKSKLCSWLNWHLPTLSDPFGRTIKLRPNPLSSALRNRLLITFVVKDGSCFYKHKKPSLICESQNKYNATFTVCYTAIHGILHDCKLNCKLLVQR